MPQTLEPSRKTKIAQTQDGANTEQQSSLVTDVLFEPLLSDFRIIFERDPAARNWLEVLFCYPG